MRNMHYSLVVQETTKLQKIDQHAKDLTESRRDDAFLDASKQLQLSHYEVEKMIASVMFRYEDNTLRWITDGMNQKTPEDFSTNLR